MYFCYMIPIPFFILRYFTNLIAVLDINLYNLLISYSNHNIKNSDIKSIAFTLHNPSCVNQIPTGFTQTKKKLIVYPVFCVFFITWK